MKVSKMPGFGSYGAIVDDFNWDDPSSYIELQEINLKSLVTVVRGNGQDNFRSLSKNARHTFSVRSPSAKWMTKYGSDWKNKLTESEKKSVSSIDNWADGLTHESPGWSRVSGKLDNQGRVTGAFGDTSLTWHVDEPGSLMFYPLVALYGAEHMHTSATSFIQTADWYAGLSESFRSELNDLVAVYDMTKTQYGIDEINRDIIITNQGAAGRVEMPLVTKNPVGIPGIRYGTQITKFVDVPQKEADAIINKIKKEIFDPKYAYDYWWEHERGDFVMLDNSITIHERKVRSDLDMSQELRQRVAYRATADYTGYLDYDPFLIESFNAQRKKQIHELIAADFLTIPSWTRHLDIIKPMDRLARLHYIKNNVPPAERVFLLEEIKNENN